MLNIVLFGPPGAGKGTQSDKLKAHYNLVHLSTGDLLRGQIEEGTELGREAKNYMDNGKLVPDEVVIGMIEEKLKENSRAHGFIFDGFPRTREQAKALDDMLEKNNTRINGMLSLQVDEDELIRRLVSRGETSGRADDTREVIEKRVNEYEEKTAPVAGYYKEQGKFHPIIGMGTIDDIFSRLKEAIDKLTIHNEA